MAELDITYSYFDMEHGDVGRYTPEQAISAMTPYSPGVAGWNPNQQGKVASR